MAWVKFDCRKSSQQLLLLGSWAHLESVDLADFHLAPRLLCVNVPLHRRGADIARRANIERASPQTRHPGKVREFLSEQARSLALHLSHDVRRAPLRQRGNEQVDVIGHDLQRDDLALDFLTRFNKQLPQSRFHVANQYLAPIAGQEDEVVGQRGHGCLCATNRCSHTLIVAELDVNCNRFGGFGSRYILRLKPIGFATLFYNHWDSSPVACGGLKLSPGSFLLWRDILDIRSRAPVTRRAK